MTDEESVKIELLGRTENVLSDMAIKNREYAQQLAAAQLELAALRNICMGVVLIGIDGLVVDGVAIDVKGDPQEALQLLHEELLKPTVAAPLLEALRYALECRGKWIAGGDSNSLDGAIAALEPWVTK